MNLPTRSQTQSGETLVSDRTFSYSIELEIPASYTGSLLDFVYQKYILPEERQFSDVSRAEVDGLPALRFIVLDDSRAKKLDVTVKGSKPLELKVVLLDEKATEETADRVRQDILIVAEMFEEKVRESTLFFAWREGEKIVPEKISGKEKKSLNRILLETQVFLSIIFITLGIFVFFILGPYTPIVLLAFQFVFVIFSPRIIERTADWKITKEDPTIHMVEYNLPIEEHDSFRKKYPPEKIAEIKKQVYQETIAKNGEIDCETTGQIFRKFGFECSPENLSVKKVNVYELVKKVADKFHFKVPKIIVANTLLPNAAATGPSPSRGLVLITTGAMVQLEEDELQSVLGHEFGHLKGRDPFWLFALSAFQYLLWFYVIFGFFPTSSFFLVIIYFWVLSTITYFIAKFFEARADLTSAIVMGQPNILANALEEIGFKRLLVERIPSYRIQEWISFDPHPPIYFRVNRLRKFKEGTKIAHPLIQSAKEVTRGFFDSL
jgi:heat shock protein HtpX